MKNFWKKIFSKKRIEERELRSAEEVRKHFKKITEKNKVVAAIENAAKANQTSVSIKGLLEEDLKKELEEKGYQVREFTYACDNFTAIEW